MSLCFSNNWAGIFSHQPPLAPGARGAVTSAASRSLLRACPVTIAIAVAMCGGRLCAVACSSVRLRAVDGGEDVGFGAVGGGGGGGRGRAHLLERVRHGRAGRQRRRRAAEHARQHQVEPVHLQRHRNMPLLIVNVLTGRRPMRRI